MPIQVFHFGSTHSWSDHGRVKDAVDAINKLPQYGAGGVRLGSTIYLSSVESLIGQEKSYIAQAEKRYETMRCDGYNAENLDAQRNVIRNLEAYASALETIRDYMKSYSACGC
jgi:hypothetical protein